MFPKDCAFVGFADNLHDRICHNGWFINAFQDETLRGWYTALPAQHGKERLIAGYADPNNDNCARLDFADIYANARDAAYAADRIAENAAEKEREYNSAWTAGSDYQSNQQEIKEHRASLIALVQAYNTRTSPRYGKANNL